MRSAQTLFMIAVLSLSAALCLLECRNQLCDRKLPGFSRTLELYVRPDTPAEEVLDSLRSAARRPRRIAGLSEREGVDFRVGHYVIEPENTAVYALRALRCGWQTPVRLTLSGALRRRGDIARKISAQMLVDSAEVRAAMDSSALLERFGLEPESVFALFLPDTYEAYWTESVVEIFEREARAVDAFWTEERLEKARSLRLDRRRATILASIVQSETNHTPEMPRIAGVYENRLRIGMKLQADPTIAFCYDYDLKRILKSNLRVRSPYNTYLNYGLPPAPICSPSREALEAVLNPDFGSGNLYFCADPSFNGTHRFARTYREHQKNAREFQKALNNRKNG